MSSHRWLLPLAFATSCASSSPPRSVGKALSPTTPSKETLQDDVDGDRIRGAYDNCPTDPETFNGVLDEDGCSDECLVESPPGHIGIACNTMSFDYNSGSIKSESKPQLVALARTLIANPQIELVQIEVHTDERGSDPYNLDLSEERASAVMSFLLAQGVRKSRIRAKGFGEHCPLDPAHNEAAWAANRRTLFRIAKYDGIPNYDPLGCAAATALGVVSLPVP